MNTDQMNSIVFPAVLDQTICTLAQSDFSVDPSKEGLLKSSQSRAFSPIQLFDYHCALAILFSEGSNDSMSALMHVAQARKVELHDENSRVTVLIALLLQLRQGVDALDVYLDMHFKNPAVSHVNADTLKRLALAYQVWLEQAEAQRTHGHTLLMDGVKTWLAKHPQSPTQGPLRLLEVGSTREEVAGQGSTRKLSEFCLSNGLLFTTVDMDPFNTEQAAKVFKEQSAEAFEAVNAKGEDYLRQTSLVFHFVFLDAYDFDHGRHSEQRQSRYRKFLGGPIDEAQCHQMHLECAQALLQSLHPEGLVCIDDTWLDDGHWTAKGTLAVPYLLQQGFEFVDIRNRAVLMRRTPLNADGHGYAKPV